MRVYPESNYEGEGILAVTGFEVGNVVGCQTPNGLASDSFDTCARIDSVCAIAAA
jgi:hypothetical protein